MTTSLDSTTSPDQDDLEGVDLPGFRPPPAAAGPDPLDPETSTITTTTAASPEGDPTASPSDDPGSWNGPGPAGPSVGPASSPSPTTSSRASTADPLPFIEIARTFVGLAGLLVRTIRARRRPYLHPEAWLPTEDEQTAIGEPLGRIAARHAPVSGEGSADVADGVAAMVGATGYAVRSLALEAEGDANAQALDVDQSQPTESL